MKRAMMLVLALLAAGCAARDPELLVDPGFETGGEAWTWLDWSEAWQGPFEVASTDARSGSRALVTRLEADAARDVAIRGAVQNVSAERAGGAIPERLSGHYRVDAWTPDAEKLYAQVVLAAASDVGGCGSSGRAPCQIAYVLGGIEEDPFAISNRRFLFLDRGDPEVGEWRSFDVRPAEDFAREWGNATRGFHTLTLYLEVRNEYGGEERAPVAASVRWDDLSMR